MYHEILNVNAGNILTLYRILLSTKAVVAMIVFL